MENFNRSSFQFCLITSGADVFVLRKSTVWDDCYHNLIRKSVDRLLQGSTLKPRSPPTAAMLDLSSVSTMLSNNPNVFIAFETKIIILILFERYNIIENVTCGSSLTYLFIFVRINDDNWFKVQYFFVGNNKSFKISCCLC